MTDGDITFLLTDVEGSTRLWEDEPDAMAVALQSHDEIVERVIMSHGGSLVRERGEGDSGFAVFTSPASAAEAAVELQRLLGSEAWPTEIPIRVRIAIHTGPAQLRAGQYYGTVVNRCARIRAIAHGGQVLVSAATAEAVRGNSIVLKDLGHHRLRDLSRPEHVFQLTDDEFPPLQSLDAAITNLPVQLTSFVGRDMEIAETRKFLDAVRLLTLTGTGGVGKTRLALQLGSEASEDFPDGVWFVDLAPVGDPALVASTAAKAVGIRDEPGRDATTSVTDHLREHTTLLILDNCEHLIEAAAEFAGALLARCAKSKIVATSRQPLDIAGEAVWRVPSLEAPDPDDVTSAEEALDYEAVRLFCDRAALARFAWQLSGTNASAVMRICRRLNGIPLAIELAAARIRSMSAEEIDERLSDVFALLTGGSRTVMPRQQTLRAAIDWSYELLSDDERTLFRGLSVFAGGWTLEAASQVFGDDVLDPMSQLTDQSLVELEEVDGATRYDLLEPLREYADAASSDDERALVREQHFDCFAALALAGAVETGTSADPERLDAIERDHDNVRAAIRWGIANRPDDALKMATDLYHFWHYRGYWNEGRELLASALEHAAADPTGVRARAYHCAGNLALLQGDFAAAVPHFEDARAMYDELDDPRGTVGAVANLSVIAYQTGDKKKARAGFEEALDIYCSMGDQYGQARNLTNLGSLSWEDGDYESARAYFDESLEIFRGLNDQVGIAATLGGLGNIATHERDYEEAERLYTESLEVSRELGEMRGAATSMSNLGLVAMRREQFDRAREIHVEALEIRRKLGEKMGIAHSLENLAPLLGPDRAEQAVRLLGAAEALLESIGASPAPDQDREAGAQRLRDELGADAFDAAWSKGRSMSEDDAIALALEVSR